MRNIIAENSNLEEREEFYSVLKDGDVYYDARPYVGSYLKWNSNEGYGVGIEESAAPSKLRGSVSLYMQDSDVDLTSRSPLRTRDRLRIEAVGSGNPEHAKKFLEETGLYDIRTGADGEHFYRLKGAEEWGVIDPQGWQGFEEFGKDLAHYASKILFTGTSSAKGAAAGFTKGLAAGFAVGGPWGAGAGALLGAVGGGAMGAAFGETLRQQVGQYAGVNPMELEGFSVDEIATEAAFGAIPFEMIGRTPIPRGVAKRAVPDIRPDEIADVSMTVARQGRTGATEAAGRLTDESRQAMTRLNEEAFVPSYLRRVDLDDVGRTFVNTSEGIRRMPPISQMTPGERRSWEALKTQEGSAEAAIRRIENTQGGWQEAIRSLDRRAKGIESVVDAAGRQGKIARGLPRVTNALPMPAVIRGSQVPLAEAYGDSVIDVARWVGDKIVPDVAAADFTQDPYEVAMETEVAEVAESPLQVDNLPELEEDAYEAALGEFAGGDDFYIRDDGSLVVNIGGKGKPEDTSTKKNKDTSTKKNKDASTKKKLKQEPESEMTDAEFLRIFQGNQ